jgi:hypothetical protein
VGIPPSTSRGSPAHQSLARPALQGVRRAAHVHPPAGQSPRLMRPGAGAGRRPKRRTPDPPRPARGPRERAALSEYGQIRQRGACACAHPEHLDANSSRIGRCGSFPLASGRSSARPDGDRHCGCCTRCCTGLFLLLDRSTFWGSRGSLCTLEVMWLSADGSATGPLDG